MNRRQFLGLMAGLALPVSAAPIRSRAAGRSRAERVAVVGGGIAGVTFTLHLKRLVPEVEITVIEPEERFLFAPATLEYVFGRVSCETITRGYDILARHGIRHLRAEVAAVEPERRRVRTTAGALGYDRLVIASGIRLATEDIAGLDAHPEANAGLYDRTRLHVLRERIAAFRGGTALLSIPPPPHSCPPAAYEFALLLAGQIRSKRLNGKVLVLDANTQPEPPPLSAAFDSAFRQAGVIEYIPLIRVARLEAEARRVVSADGEAFSYDLLSLIPAHRAARFIREAGLSEGADLFVQVDPLSFRAVRHETVYALGDAARTPYARSAAPAFDAARLCAHTVAKSLGAKRIDPPPLAFEAPCYPYVTGEQAMSLRLRYRREKDADLDIEVLTDTRPDRTHVAARQAWQQELIREMFGA